MKDTSYRVALGGIVSALCLVTMFLAGVMPALYLLLPMIAGVLLMIIAIEVNKGWAFLTYLSVSLLSLFVTFDKEAALIFILFFGHYPILRMNIQKIKAGFLRRGIKFILFNACTLIYVWSTVWLLGMDEMMKDMDDLGKYGGYIMLGLANLVFVLYDVNLDFAYNLYRSRLMPKFRKKK
jgi:hypothetical protein